MYNFLVFAAFYVVANVIIAYALKYFSEEFSVEFNWSELLIGVQRFDIGDTWEWIVHPLPFIYYSFIFR